MSLLSLDRLSVRRGGCPVLAEATLAIGAGEFVGLIGPNGAGKTTLLRAALGLMPHAGRSSLAALPPAARARAAAFLPQGREVAWPLSVADLVGLGRAPWGPGPQDGPAVARALDRLRLDGLRTRDATTLSGGELARVLIARVLAQETPLILADEPVAGLDPEAQLRVMGLFAALAAEGRGVMASIHDLGLAARFCTRLVLIAGGRITADGPPGAVLSDANLAAAFGIRAFRADTPDGPVLQPLVVVR